MKINRIKYNQTTTNPSPSRQIIARETVRPITTAIVEFVQTGVSQTTGGVLGARIDRHEHAVMGGVLRDVGKGT